MKKDVLKVLLIPTIIAPMLASDDFSTADLEAAMRASMEGTHVQQPGATHTPPPAGPGERVVVALKLPESVVGKLEGARIAPDIFRAYTADDVAALSFRGDFTPYDIAHIKCVLFGVSVPEKYMALQCRPEVGHMKNVVDSVLEQINTFGDVHQHDAFCAANIDKLLNVAKNAGLGKSSFQDEVEKQKQLGKTSDEVWEVTVRFFMLFSKEKVAAEHGFSAAAGDGWIRDAVKKAAEDPKILSLVAYTVSILNDLKELEGDPRFDTLKYLVLQQVMENYKENGGCLEGVRNRAMKSLAMLLNFILNA